MSKSAYGFTVLGCPTNAEEKTSALKVSVGYYSACLSVGLPFRLIWKLIFKGLNGNISRNVNLHP